jgi:hypothetical protein
MGGINYSLYKPNMGRLNGAVFVSFFAGKPEVSPP